MFIHPTRTHPELPERLAQAVWRGDALGGARHAVISTGHDVLDAELPGGGWPCQGMTEILVARATGPSWQSEQLGQPGQAAHAAHAEWRLLGPGLADLTRRGGSVLLIGPPHSPYLPGLAREGLMAERLICIDADTPAERLWATEHALKAHCVSAVLSWLPQARAEDVRRLHACAARHPGLFFAFRPERVRADSSAAPLRLLLGLGPCPHPLRVDILKRRGPLLERSLTIARWPLGLQALLPTARPAQALPPRPSLPAHRTHPHGVPGLALQPGP